MIDNDEDVEKLLIDTLSSQNSVEKSLLDFFKDSMIEKPATVTKELLEWLDERGFEIVDKSSNRK